jgi:hypothetical protein
MNSAAMEMFTTEPRMIMSIEGGTREALAPDAAAMEVARPPG